VVGTRSSTGLLPIARSNILPTVRCTTDNAPVSRTGFASGPGPTFWLTRSAAADFRTASATAVPSGLPSRAGHARRGRGGGPRHLHRRRRHQRL